MLPLEVARAGCRWGWGVRCAMTRLFAAGRLDSSVKRLPDGTDGVLGSRVSRVLWDFSLNNSARNGAAEGDVQDICRNGHTLTLGQAAGAKGGTYPGGFNWKGTAGHDLRETRRDLWHVALWHCTWRANTRRLDGVSIRSIQRDEWYD
ncbi:hypothetical protein GLOTRDRAFT_112775, partial [Gloeophyllum trabeum ATCC 11539]